MGPLPETGALDSSLGLPRAPHATTKISHLASSGPAACRGLPTLDAEQRVTPLEASLAESLGERIGLKRVAARRRIQRMGGSSGISLAPAALSAFEPAELSLAAAGVPLDQDTLDPMPLAGKPNAQAASAKP